MIIIELDKSNNTCAIYAEDAGGYKIDITDITEFVINSSGAQHRAILKLKTSDFKVVHVDDK